MLMITKDRRVLTVKTPWLRRELRDQPRPPQADRARGSVLASQSTAARPRASRPRRTGGARARAGPEDGEAPPSEAERRPDLSPVVPLTSQQSAGLASLLDLLTGLWAEEAVRGLLTGNEHPAEDTEMNGAAVRVNASTAPDPQRVEARAGLSDPTGSAPRAHQPEGA